MHGDFHWWQWLLGAIGAGILSAICHRFEEEEFGESRKVPAAIGIVTKFVTVLCITVAVIRFAKWVMAG